MSSVRDYAILWVGATKGGGSGAALGGNALLRTAQHKLDGIEHLIADDTTRLDATTQEHGLLPKLSGDAGDVLHGDGTFGPSTGAESLDDLDDVVITSATSADRLRFDATNWVNSPLIWRQVFALDPSTGNYVPVTADGQGVLVEA